ncbi:hypothetical protein [Staphylococcus ratti]|uniref:Uncharacterized protein n=1 Tax=Staphylococcus ratti TaxID=2892440 RepID=A0ABY3PC10_9STAP|nr:hypothetical protein [Staphylococcus ratti]UEX89798.1 hypothetical protein LN051_09540 [Staphylococcus ratti]
MAHNSKRQQFIFIRNMIALPYVIFAIVMMTVLLFSPQLIWFVATIGVFMVYHVIATFIAFLLKYGKLSLLLCVMTLCIVGIFAVILNVFFALHR